MFIGQFTKDALNENTAKYGAGIRCINTKVNCRIRDVLFTLGPVQSNGKVYMDKRHKKRVKVSQHLIHSIQGLNGSYRVDRF